jgi:hypothetical protein
MRQIIRLQWTYHTGASSGIFHSSSELSTSEPAFYFFFRKAAIRDTPVAA